MRGSNKQRRLGMESLEQKAMLAGDVGVQIIDGTLMIEGDELTNQIQITAGEVEGQYVITGLAGEDGVQTTINGSTDAFIVEESVTDVVITTDAGDDAVTLSGVEFEGSVAIETGDGADTVLLGSATVDGEAAAEAMPLVVGKSLLVSTGAGDDTIAGLDVEVGKQLIVSTGDDNDTVTLGAAVDPEAEVEVDPSLTVHGMVLADLGAGDDLFTLQGAEVDKRVMVHGGDGVDTITVDSVDAGKMLAIHAGDGDDLVSIRAAAATHALLHAGDGNDSVTISDAVFTRLGAHLGDGDDSLALNTTVVSRMSLIHGGDGTNTLENVDSELGRLISRGFEVAAPVEPTTPVETLSKALKRRGGK